VAIENDLAGILEDVVDPETGYSIMAMGLVYRAERAADGIEVDFTLTYPGCPVGDEIAERIVAEVSSATGTKNVVVRLVWDPPWNDGLMSDALKIEFGVPV
jgi:metal-sulfur cluster biosynthetic enzyme